MSRFSKQKSKRPSKIWENQLVETVVKGSFKIWLDKCGYINQGANPPKSTLEWVMNAEDDLDPTEEEILLLHHQKLDNSRKYMDGPAGFVILKEYSPIVRDDITNENVSDSLKKE
jgi:hypothetical protein